MKLLALAVAALLCLGVTLPPAEELQGPQILWGNEVIPMRCVDIRHALDVANEVLALLRQLQELHPYAMAGHRESVGEYMLGYEAVEVQKMMLDMEVWYCTKV